MESGLRDAALLEGWLQPLPDADEPCGKDLEYDNDFLALSQAAQGKPETQFGAGEPPDWADVREKSEALLARTRDLRVALFWLRASVNLRGFPAVSPAIRLIHGLLDRFWDHLHPVVDPEDGDAYARANALAILPQQDGLLGDLRQATLFSLPGIGPIRVRSILVALNQMNARADEVPLGKDQISQMMGSAIEQDPAFREQPAQVLAELSALSAVMAQRLGHAATPDLAPLVDVVKLIQSLMPVIADESTESQTEAAGDSPDAGRLKAALGSVNSRDDALRAIDMVCAFLDRTEPTNPAQLLLRRARRLINHNFLQLIKELAPDALNEAARVMGVDPDSVNLDSGL